MTLAGEMYRSNGNPEGYEPTPEPEADALVTFGTSDDILSNDSLINGVQCTNYVRKDGVTATASTENGNGGKASNAIDNVKNTRWESKHSSDDEYITVDLGSEKSIKQLQILWEDASASDYTVEVSNDGQNFTSVATVSGASRINNRLDTIMPIFVCFETNSMSRTISSPRRRRSISPRRSESTPSANSTVTVTLS